MHFVCWRRWANSASRSRGVLFSLCAREGRRGGNEHPLALFLAGGSSAVLCTRAEFGLSALACDTSLDICADIGREGALDCDTSLDNGADTGCEEGLDCDASLEVGADIGREGGLAFGTTRAIGADIGREGGKEGKRHVDPAERGRELACAAEELVAFPLDDLICGLSLAV